MLAAIVFTFSSDEVADLKIALILAVVMLAAVALYDLFPEWRP